MRVIVFCWRQSFRLCHKTGLSPDGASHLEEEKKKRQGRGTEGQRRSAQGRRGDRARRRAGAEEEARRGRRRAGGKGKKRQN